MIKQDKNFHVRLKASVERAAKSSGLLKKVLKGSKHYEEYENTLKAFNEALEDITVQYLQGELPVRNINVSARSNDLIVSK